MTAKSFSSRVLKSFLYSSLGNTIGKLINVFALFAVLKLITPEELGIASIVLAIFAVTQAISEMGIGVSIVQADNLNRREIDSLFWLSLAITIIIYVIIFLGAPLIAYFYEEPLLYPLIQVHGIIVVIFSFYMVPRNMLKRDLSFREIAIIDNLSLLVSSVIMLLLAFYGFGAWVFILAEVGNRLGQLIISQYFYPYWPKLQFNFKEIKERVWFGLYATGSRLLYNLYSNSDYLIVGRVFGAEAVGIYTLAYRVIGDTVKTLTSNINEVAYPTFARLQNEIDRLRKYFYTIARGSLILSSLILIVIAVYIDEILLLGGYGQWLDAVPLIQLFAFVGILRTISPLVPQLLNAVGQARLNFYYSLTNAIIMPVAFMIGAQYSLLSVGWAWVVGYPLVVALLFYFGSRVLKHSYIEFTRHIFTSFWLLPLMLGTAIGLQYLLNTIFGVNSLLIPIIGVLITFGGGLGFLYWIERDTIKLLRGQKKSDDLGFKI